MKTRAREDQLIFGYLLGTASELEQSQIETRYFREPRFFEQMLALEEELICEYLNDTLTATERRRFEQHFLGTPRRRRKYESTRKLMTFVADQRGLETATRPPLSAPGVLTAWSNRLNNFFLPRLNFVWSLAAVTVLSVGVWMLSIRVAELRNQIEQSETQQVAGKKTRPKARSKADKSRASSDKDRLPVVEIADQLQASLDPIFIESDQFAGLTKVIDVSLPPSRLRGVGQAQRITLPVTAAALRLRLLLRSTEQAQFTSYNAVLKTMEGREIMRQQDMNKQVAQSDKSLTLEVAAKQLKQGHYVVLLTGITAGKELKPAAEFFVQIIRE